MTLHVPESLKNGHESMRAALKRAMREPGRTGEAAMRVARILEGHLLREEKFALRPLGLLRALGRGETPAELAEAVRLVRELRLQMPQMIEEHRQIAEALKQLAQAAEAEAKHEYVELAEDMILHAHVEEDVLYPAAQLVGRYAELVRPD